MTPTRDEKHRRETRAEQKARSRRRILDSAREVFTRIGFEATNIRDIIRGSGFSPGTFYNHFQTKEAVFEVLLAEVVDTVREQVRIARGEASDAFGFLEGAYLAYFRVFTSDQELLRLVTRNQPIFRGVVFGYRPSNSESDSHAEPGTDSSSAQDKSAMIGGIIDDLVLDLETAMKNGYFPESVPARSTAVAMVGAGFETLMQMVDDPDFTPEAAAAFLARLFISGLNGFDPKRRQ